MARNGQQYPSRPRIELRQSPASPEEAAAIAAAIEQFLRDTAPPPGSPEPRVNPWARAGIMEAAKLQASAPTPWGDPLRWGS